MQMLHPWRNSSDFIDLVTQINSRPEANLFDSDGNLNLESFTILTHTSISSISSSTDFLQMLEEAKDTNEKIRKQAYHIDTWTPYAREMSIFYFDLFVEYV